MPDDTRVTTSGPTHALQRMRFERWYDRDADEVWCALTGDVDPVPDESVVAAAAPTLLVCTTGDDVVRWELADVGDRCRVVVTLTIGAAARVGLLAAGVHAALEQVADAVEGFAPTTGFDDLVRWYADARSPAA